MHADMRADIQKDVRSSNSNIFWSLWTTQTAYIASSVQNITAFNHSTNASYGKLLQTGFLHAKSSKFHILNL